MPQRQRLLALVLVLVLILVGNYQARGSVLHQLEKKATDLKTTRKRLETEQLGLKQRLAAVGEKEKQAASVGGRLLGEQYAYQFAALLNEAQRASGSTWISQQWTNTQLGGTFYKRVGSVRINGSLDQVQAFVKYLEHNTVMVQVSNLQVSKDGNTFEVAAYFRTDKPVPDAVPLDKAAAAPASAPGH